MSIGKKISMVCLILVSLGFLSACGTVKGFGKDVSKVGHGIQKASNL